MQKWATDITEFKVKEKKLYLSPIIDLFNQEVISYEITDRPVFKGVMDMLKKALPKARGASQLLLHSDQAGNTKCLNINSGSKKTESLKACPEKEIALIMP
ncbi:hypothetical protein L950_0223080 [Sphingobacterium sp. IITKGP-BTPF85]|nr:DDE-type integrase/transposase/recombinase [Sphingobacterium sp. IITKGP-BTPF85]KKX48054.1 hypothetical protein L950_0223080 [Sphingobacterium sp. IITKGP-BTPF85]